MPRSASTSACASLHRHCQATRSKAESAGATPSGKHPRRRALSAAVRCKPAWNGKYGQSRCESGIAARA
eukprot:15431346-Alexandrium_andersonii.AAC.1